MTCAHSGQSQQRGKVEMISGTFLAVNAEEEDKGYGCGAQLIDGCVRDVNGRMDGRWEVVLRET